MRTSLAVGVAAAAAGAALVGAVYGPADGVVTLLLLAAVAGLALAAGHVAAARRSRLGGLRRQFVVSAAIAVGAILLAVWTAAAAMFVSPHDALVVTAMTASMGAVAVRAGLLLSEGAARDARAVRDGLAAVERGEREVAVPAGGRDELAEIAGATRAMSARLGEEERARERADAARRRLVASVSHDLRTPLASLRLLVESVQDGVVTGADAERYVHQMGGHVSTLAALVDDLFELSRLEAGEVTWSLRRIELGGLVAETVESLRVHAAARGVSMATDVPREGVSATADPDQIQRVLANLIINAIRHTPADGSVTVRARRDGGDAEVEVADTGTGIAPSARVHVFEPFFRADDARSGDGAGLGLAIAQAIVAAHGGRIWLDPCEVGTRIRFRLRSAGP